MFVSLRHFPIERKLRLVILTTCTAALCVASATLFALQFYFYQRDYKRDLFAVGRIIAEMCTGAIGAGLPESTRDILFALRAKPHIVGAFVRVKEGGRVYGQFGNLDQALLDASVSDGFQTFGRELIYVQPIADDNERLGTLYLVSDYRADSLRLLGLYAGILVAVLCVSFLVAVLVSSKLERLISGPILRLAETARRIGSRSDYTLRAPKFAEDEVGEFTDSFNNMLEQIENRDAALLHQIAERTRAEQELQRVHNQLMDASRRAGMAEVATGVLHNVGNVLNSVNVSATLIAEKLGTSRAENVLKAARLLRDQNGRLAEFLTEDPKGKLLPSYLADATEHIVQERANALDELESLTKNIEHIKDIVSMQQSYARVSGVVEILSVEALIEDAIRMHAAAFQRHRVELVRDFHPVPRVPVDKHKVLQILVNLMRNAKYALDEGAPREKRITVTLRRKDDHFIEIIVADNGIGISEENLTRIFSHGFTTRKDGHGFGLHSGALAAQQMGGTLTAASEGIGRGAAFSLTLLISAEAQK